jgi:hypothetical protein
MVIALGIAVLFQFIILRIKWNKGRYEDVGVDILMLAILNGIFGGSILGVISATAGSTLISLYLIWYPIKLFNREPTTGSSSTGKKQDVYSDLADRIDKLGLILEALGINPEDDAPTTWEDHKKAVEDAAEPDTKGVSQNLNTMSLVDKLGKVQHQVMNKLLQGLLEFDNASEVKALAEAVALREALRAQVSE